MRRLRPENRIHELKPPMNTKFPSLMFALTVALTACGGSDRAATSHAKLETVAAESEQEDARTHVELSPEQIRIAALEIAPVQSAAIHETMPLYGVIAANAERVRDVSARFPGLIRTVEKRIGDVVKQGDTLATVESNESLRTYAVTAPQAGVITARDANAGEQSGEKRLFTVADLSTVWIELPLFPRDAAKVRLGQQVHIQSVDTDLRTDGVLVYVAPFGTSANQTLTARVLIDNPAGRWAPGLYVSADVVLSEQPAALTVRSEAVQEIDGRSVVFVQIAEGRFEPRPVKLGRSDSELSEVLDGLSLRERYVAKGSFIVKSQIGAGSAEHDH